MQRDHEEDLAVACREDSGRIVQEVLARTPVDTVEAHIVYRFGDGTRLLGYVMTQTSTAPYQHPSLPWECRVQALYGVSEITLHLDAERSVAGVVDEHAHAPIAGDDLPRPDAKAIVGAVVTVTDVDGDGHPERLRFVEGPETQSYEVAEYRDGEWNVEANLFSGGL